MPRTFIDILNDIVDGMRSTGSILSIVESSPGSYTIVTDKINDLLSVRQTIVISDTVGFNGSFRVESINYGTKEITISSTTGITIPAELGSYKSNAPYYYYTWDPEQIPDDGWLFTKVE